MVSSSASPGACSSVASGTVTSGAGLPGSSVIVWSGVVSSGAGCSVPSGDGCSVSPGDGCSVSPGDGCSVPSGAGCSVPSGDGCSVSPWSICSVASLDFISSLSFRLPSVVSVQTTAAFLFVSAARMDVTGNDVAKIVIAKRTDNRFFMCKILQYSYGYFLHPNNPRLCTGSSFPSLRASAFS